MFLKCVKNVSSWILKHHGLDVGSHVVDVDGGSKGSNSATTTTTTRNGTELDHRAGDGDHSRVAGRARGVRPSRVENASTRFDRRRAIAHDAHARSPPRTLVDRSRVVVRRTRAAVFAGLGDARRFGDRVLGFRDGPRTTTREIFACVIGLRKTTGRSLNRETCIKTGTPSCSPKRQRRAQKMRRPPRRRVRSTPTTDEKRTSWTNTPAKASKTRRPSNKRSSNFEPF